MLPLPPPVLWWMMTEQHRFASALDWLWPVEGGWYDGKDKRDVHPTNYGITETTWKAHGTKKPLREITKADAAAIYFEHYWRSAKCQDLPWPIALVHFDAAVNHGVGQARKFLPLANGSWAEYIALRRQFYADLIARKPDMAGNRKGWENRMVRLEKACRSIETSPLPV